MAEMNLFEVAGDHSLDELIDELRQHGATPVHTFHPSWVIAQAPRGIHLVAGERVPDDRDPATLPPAGRTAVQLIRHIDAKASNAAAPPPVLDWDVPGKTPPQYLAQSDRQPHSAIHAAPMPSTGTPTSRFLAGRVGVAVVIVSRQPTGAAHEPAEVLTSAERDTAFAEVAEGLGWFALEEPRAFVEFALERRDIDINVAPDLTLPDTYEDRERVWRDPALAALGLSAGASGYAALARQVRDLVAATWGIVIFVTRYPLHHFAYASGERLVLDYQNDGWGTSQLNRVAAHESAHLFGALDEYAASGCNCTETGGELAVANGNCKGCAATFVNCLMAENTLSICSFSRGQIGWAAPLIGEQSAWVTALYADLLDRRPESGGFGHWLVKLRGGTAHQDIAGFFTRSPEFCSNKARTFYRRFLGREGEPNGVTFWTGELAQRSEQDVIVGFCDSLEYRGRFRTDDDFVESLYANVLGRGSDSGGKAHWVGALGNGSSRAEVIRGFLASDEYAGREVENFYQQLLGRGSDPAGLASWVGQVKSGAALQDIVRDFCVSAEYRQRATSRF